MRDYDRIVVVVVVVVYFGTWKRTYRLGQWNAQSQGELTHSIGLILRQIPLWWSTFRVLFLPKQKNYTTNESTAKKRKKKKSENANLNERKKNPQNAIL